MKRGLPSGRSAFLAGKLLVERTVLFRLFLRRAQRVFGFGERLLQLPDLRFQRLDLVLQLGCRSFSLVGFSGAAGFGFSGGGAS